MMNATRALTAVAAAAVLAGAGCGPGESDRTPPNLVLTFLRLARIVERTARVGVAPPNKVKKVSPEIGAWHL
jgi:hypothetical protein